MKRLRNIWIILGLLSVVEISAATYGTSYRAPHRQTAYYPARAEIPSAMMGSVNSDMMYSGTALPLAAATGTSTAGDSPTQGGPRRATMEDPDPFGGQTIGGTTNPTEPGTPIGDAVIPLLIMMMIYVVKRVFCKRTRVFRCCKFGPPASGFPPNLQSQYPATGT